MTWSLGQKANDRSGATWAKAWRDWTAPSYVTADAGTGPQAGIAAVQHERQEQGEPPLENGLDVFHTTHEARRVWRQRWSHVDRCWEQAEAATRRVEQAQRQGQDARGVAVAARAAWKKAEAAFERYERSEAGGKMAHGALSVFRPEGHWNDRAWAEQQIALALPLLSGRAWSEVRGFLQAKQTLTFLDRLHRQSREAVPRDRLRAELVRLWWLRRRRPRANTPVVVVGAGHVAHLVQQVVCQEVDANRREAYAAVSRVLRLTVRASSAVGCMNGVLRMHQSRPKTVTQGLLDLKRLYLELSRIPWGEAAWPLPLRAPGAETAQLSVLGPALDANPGSRGDLIPSSVKLQSYALGRSRNTRHSPCLSTIVIRSYDTQSLSGQLGTTESELHAGTLGPVLVEGGSVWVSGGRIT